MSNARNLARLLPNASGQLPASNLAVAGANLKSGYIQSKTAGMFPTNDMTGDQNCVDPTNGVTTGLSVDMGIPNSVNSVFHVKVDAQIYLDQHPEVDSGAYCGVGIMRKIGSGSWVVIRNQGDWGQGANDNVDNNIRAELFVRDRPATNQQVQYKLVFNTHRGGCYWGRVPTNSVGYTANIFSTEYDTGEVA